MIYEFENDVKEHIQYFYDNYENICNFNEYDEKTFSVDSPLYVYGQEVMGLPNTKNNLIKRVDKIRSSGESCYISTSTITPSEYELHPLASLHIHWFEFHQRYNIAWNFKSANQAFDSNTYDYRKELVFDKTIKSILSIRKKTHKRDYLFSKLNYDEFSSNILRYARYINNPSNETKNDIELANKFPSWNELQKEYKSSIFSFIIETDSKDRLENDCQMSEKTIMAFMNGTIPIIIGRENNVKLLKDLGFYVWNDEFGYGDSDKSLWWKDRVSGFVKCYDNVKKLSFEESKKYWLDNKDKVQKNYDIISNLIVKKWN
jgi:hypothetical protein